MVQIKGKLIIFMVLEDIKILLTVIFRKYENI